MHILSPVVSALRFAAFFVNVVVPFSSVMIFLQLYILRACIHIRIHIFIITFIKKYSTFGTLLSKPALQADSRGTTFKNENSTTFLNRSEHRINIEIFGTIFENQK